MSNVLRPLVLGILIASVSSLALAEGRHGSRHPGTSHGHHVKHGNHRTAEWLGALVVLGLAGAALQVGWHFALIRGRTREGCFKAFRLNHWLGFSVFAGIALSYSQT
jgi:hypothetical protein